MTENIASLSAWLQILSALGAGLLSVLTPCVYPLIPITLSVCGATKANNRLDSFVLSTAYFLGIVCTYTILGMISAQAGIVFGSLLGYPWFVWSASFLLILLMLHSLDIVTFTGFTRLQQMGSTIGGSGVRGSFLMGTASGLIAAPCVGPVLAAVLVVAASSESVFWGAALLFSYSIGLGIPFLILGTFSSLIQNLPRSGPWLSWIKVGTAIALLITVFYLHSSSLNSTIKNLKLNTIPLAIGTVFAFGILFMKIGHRPHSSLIKLAATCLMALPLYTFFIYQPPLNTQSETASTLPWISDLSEGLREARKNNTILMVDLFAQWCGACKEFDAKTFSVPEVQNRLRSLVIARIDFTETNDVNASIAKRFDVTGLPCLLFLNADGTEISQSRITGFLEPDAFLDHISKVNKR